MYNTRMLKRFQGMLQNVTSGNKSIYIEKLILNIKDFQKN